MTRSERNKAWRQAHPERVRAYAAKSRANNRRWIRARRAEARRWLSEIKAKPCHDCGGTFPSYVMDFDHRDPATKRFGIGDLVTRRRETLLEEIAKCDVVCANCHRIRTFGARARIAAV